MDGPTKEQLEIIERLLASLCPKRKVAVVAISWVSEGPKPEMNEVGTWGMTMGAECSHNQILDALAAINMVSNQQVHEAARVIAKKSEGHLSVADIMLDVMTRQLKMVEEHMTGGSEQQLIIGKRGGPDVSKN